MKIQFKYFFSHLLVFLLNTSVNYVSAQEKITCVTYKIQTPEIKKDTNITPNLDFESTQENLKSIECDLYYNFESSIFKKVDLMDKDNDRGYKLASIFVSGTYYKNIKEKEKIKQSETFGETFNIILPYEQFKWVITSESKIINGYLCYKATSDYQEINKVRNTTKTFHPEVWFAPSIPAPYGPIGLDGLPGLVLEGKLTNGIKYYAVKINFNCENYKFKLEKPFKGKFVTEEEYQDVMVKIYKSIEEK